MVSAHSIGPLGLGGAHVGVHPAKETLRGDAGSAFDYQRPGMQPGDGFELAPAGVQRRRVVGRPYYDAEADAAAQAAYYRGISPDADPATFYRALSDKLRTTHTHQLSYSEARYDHLYKWVDVHPEDLKLHGVYTGEVFEPKDVIAQDRATDRKMEMLARLGAKVGGFLSDVLSALKYNTEHSVPQTWFDHKDPMRGDLHCLFTSSVDANSMRGSMPYGELSATVDGPGGQSNGKVFEPEGGKGAVARATLYFLMRYPGFITANEMPKSTIDILLRWHRDNPPSLWEKHRNAETAKVQGDRNPLIDHPEWAAHIDFLRGYGN